MGIWGYFTLVLYSLSNLHTFNFLINDPADSTIIA
jgi:hypothetical protein